MVSNISIYFMVLSVVLCIGVPIGAAIYSWKKYRISFRNVFVGAVVFVIFVLVLERNMHMYLLQKNQYTAAFINGSPFVFALYGALAAGIFEESGRFFGYKILLKGRFQRKDGIAYGIGHGGIEALLIGGISIIQSLYFSILINSGGLKAALDGKVSSSMLNQISSGLINTSPYLFLVSGFERVFAFIIQIGLSLVVLYAVKSKKYRFLIYAVLLHMLVDFPAGLYQKGLTTNIWIIEALCLVLAICSFLFIKSSKKFFRD